MAKKRLQFESINMLKLHFYETHELKIGMEVFCAFTTALNVDISKRGPVNPREPKPAEEAMGPSPYNVFRCKVDKIHGEGVIAIRVIDTNSSWRGVVRKVPASFVFDHREEEYEGYEPTPDPITHGELEIQQDYGGKYA